jgi:hypothetical protein
MPNPSLPIRTHSPLQAYLVAKPTIQTEEPIPVTIDLDTGALLCIDVNHMEIHEGDAFIVECSVNIADNGNAYMTFRPNRGIHAFFSINVSGAAKLSLYENIAVLSEGTPLSVLSKNRFVSNPAPFYFYTTPSGVDVTGAVILYNEKNIGGGMTQQTRVGALYQSQTEWILKPVLYYVIIHNVSGIANPISFEMECYYL